MPNIKSAAKRVRVAKKKTERNVATRSFMKTAVKKYEAEVAAGNATAAEAALRRAVSAIDKAAKKGVIHPNQADRRKSRLYAKLSAMTHGRGQEGADVTTA